MQDFQSSWESFVKKMPDPVARYDKDYKHLFINEAIEKEIGMAAGDVIGKSNRDLRIPNDEALLADLEGKIRSVFDNGQPAIYYTQHQFPNETRYYYMKLIPDFWEEGAGENRVRSVWAITRDITQLKQSEIGLKEAEASLRKQNDELNHMNADLDTFFHTVSHDLRGPIHNIKALVDMLKEASQEELPEINQMLGNSIKRVDDVLTELTDILELKNKLGQVDEVELDAVLQEVQGELQPALFQTGTKVKADFSKRRTVQFPRAFLGSIFRNMISNAIKYREETRTPHIHIKSHETEDYVTLSFQDNGIGINLGQYGEEIFKPFIQLDSEREGKGMGLNIVKSILERNGGKIEVNSEPGEGTNFICYIKKPTKV